MMDVDNLKQINDTYGHSTGDQVLKVVAQRCRENLRKIDILGRLGGDEFTILLPETDMFTASSVAERVRQYIARKPVQTSQGDVDVTISLGITRATDDTTNLDDLIGRADSAMYTAKNGGRNRVDFL
jgi:diguanylate cyclase (GGDEF)-like protein